MGVVRALWQNFIKNGATALNASSEQSAQPARWLKDQVRSDPWRSKLGWTSVVGVNDMYDFTEGSDKRVAILPAGNSPTGAAYVSALQTALNAAGLDPSSVTPTGWWKGDGIAAVEGAAIATWPDSSGAGRDLSQATEAKKPVYKHEAINGRPAVYFDGTKELSSAAALSAFITGTAGTIFVVFYEDPTSSGTREIVKDRNNKAGLSADDTNVVARNDDGAADVANKANTEGAWHLACWQHNATTLFNSLDDHDTAAQASIASGTTNDLTGVLDVGHRASASRLNGYIAEIIVFNTVLSEENRRRVAKYLVTKYALTDATTAPAWTNTYTATYDATTKKVTVARSAGAATISLAVTTGPNLVQSGWKDAGYTADKTGGTSYLADTVTHQSRHWVDADLKTSLGVTAAVIMSHNVSTSGTVKLIGGAAKRALLTAAQTALAGDAAVRIAYFSQQQARFWRLLLDDVTNPLGYAEIGVWFVGPHSQPQKSYAPEAALPPQELSTVTLADHGAPYMDERPSGRGWVLEFRGIPASDHSIWRAIANYVKVGRCFVFAFDALGVVTDVAYVFCPVPIDPAYASLGSLGLYNVRVTLNEAVQ